MATKPFEIAEEFVAEENGKLLPHLENDYNHLGKVLSRQGIDIDRIVKRAQSFKIALPSWGVSTGGTRFARFPESGEPRNIYEKLADCCAINRLIRTTPTVSFHIPWDKPDNAKRLKAFAAGLGLGFDAMNSNTFQDQPRQKLSYKFGSLTHTDPAVRRQAVDHNIECIEIGKQLGSKALTVWIGDGGNFPGQLDFRKSLDRYMESLRKIYARLPAGWRLFIEHKLFEPAFYSTVINDWGTNYWCVRELGPKAFSLVDLGHHAPNVNIEMIVARLIAFGKLGGFHFNDSKYGDDDLDSGSIKPFQLFLIFNELVGAEIGGVPGFPPAYMLDQSHNVTDPIESLISSAGEVQRAFVQASLVDRDALAWYQEKNDALMALETLKVAFRTDVSPIMAMARNRSGGAIDPISLYRKSGYRRKKEKERPALRRGGAGIV